MFLLKKTYVLFHQIQLFPRFFMFVRGCKDPPRIKHHSALFILSKQPSNSWFQCLSL